MRIIKLTLLFILFQSCNTLKNEYVYYSNTYLYHGQGLFYKFYFDKHNHTFELFSYKCSKSDTLRGNWLVKKDTLYVFDFNKKFLDSSKIIETYKKGIQNISINIKVENKNIKNNVVDIYFNDSLVTPNPKGVYNINNEDINFLRLETLTINKCFVLNQNQKSNKFDINLFFNKMMYCYTFLESKKFLIKGNKLYPVYDCSTKKIYKNHFFYKRKKHYKIKRKKAYFSHQWEPAFR